MASTHSRDCTSDEWLQQWKFPRNVTGGRFARRDAADAHGLGKNPNQPVFEKRKQRLQRNGLALKHSVLLTNVLIQPLGCLREPGLQQRFHCRRKILALLWAERAAIPHDEQAGIVTSYHSTIPS